MTTASEFAAKIVQGDADLDRLHSAVNDAPGAFTTDTGVSVDNLRKRLQDIGYKVPVAFASGLEPQDGSFTVIHNGEYYAADPGSTPFTTTGTFNAAQWVAFIETLAVRYADYTGDGSTTVFAISGTQPTGSDQLKITIDGVTQHRDAFTYAAPNVTFTDPPPVNSKIEFEIRGAYITTSTDADHLVSSTTTGKMRVTGPGTGTTRQMTIPNSDFTVARTDAAQTFTGDQTLSAGNLIIGTPGKGIDFSATSGTGTSELLDDYEEGTWTPVYVASTGSFATMTMDTIRATYVKVGKLVTVSCFIRTDDVDTTGASGSLSLSGLPYASASNCQAVGAISATDGWAGDYPLNATVGASTSAITLYYRSSVNAIDTNLNIADLTNGTSANKNRLSLTVSYEAA